MFAITYLFSLYSSGIYLPQLLMLIIFKLIIYIRFSSFMDDMKCIFILLFLHRYYLYNNIIELRVIVHKNLDTFTSFM